MSYKKLVLEFSMENAAFEDCPQEEAGRILRMVAESFEQGNEYGTIRDCNGNTIGVWDIHT